MAGQLPEFHVISNGRMPLEQFAQITHHLHPYGAVFHLREKQRSAAEIWETVEKMVELGVPRRQIMINDRADIAWAAQTAGVHLAWNSLPPQAVRQAFPGLRVGRSVHSWEEAVEMEEQGVDYLIFGHIFSSGSKPGLEPRGLDALHRVAAAVEVPVMAIGGIHPHHVSDVMKAGAAGIAVMSAVLSAGDPECAVKEFCAALQREMKEHAGGTEV